MSEKNTVEFVEDWQTGFFVVLAVAVIGVFTGLAVGSLTHPSGFLPGFIGGGILAFLAYSYLRYGR